MSKSLEKENKRLQEENDAYKEWVAAFEEGAAGLHRLTAELLESRKKIDAVLAVRVAMAFAIRDYSVLNEGYRKEVYNSLLKGRRIKIGALEKSITGDIFAHVCQQLRADPEVIKDLIFELGAFEYA